MLGGRQLIKNKKQNTTFQLLLVIILVVFLSSTLFLFCYHFDNKYTAKGPKGAFGVFLISEETLEETPYFHLISGWEMYRNKLLTPEDFKTTLLIPDEYVFIGQYRGFESPNRIDNINNPHGSATYRITLSLPETPRNYTLELPEIYSAYQLYINQELVMELGNPHPENYKPLTGNTKVVFKGAGLVEIIFAVTDFTHFYSGMIYPPAFGLSFAVDHLLHIRFGLRIGVAVLSFAVAVFYFIIWFSLKKNTLLLYYTALCCCYMVYIFYPIIKSISFTGMLWYAIERVSFPLLLLLAIRIQNKLYLHKNLLSKAVNFLGFFVCLWALSLSFLMKSNLTMMRAYSLTLTIYMWIAGFYLLISSISFSYKKKDTSILMLISTVVLATSLVMDRFLPLFDPIYFGWFSEIAGTFWVLNIGLIMAKEVAKQYRNRLQLESEIHFANQQLYLQGNQYKSLLENSEKIKALRHDLRHHLITISHLADDGKSQDIKTYIDELNQSVSTTQQLTYCNNPAINTIVSHYISLAINQGILVEAHVSCKENIESTLTMDLCILLGNLLENALEACQEMEDSKNTKFIHLIAKERENILTIVVENSYSGIFLEDQGYFFSRKKQWKEKGIGLASVNSICNKYKGYSTYEKTKDTWTVSALLYLPKNDDKE